MLYTETVYQTNFLVIQATICVYLYPFAPRDQAQCSASESGVTVLAQWTVQLRTKFISCDLGTPILSTSPNLYFQCTHRVLQVKPEILHFVISLSMCYKINS